VGGFRPERWAASIQNDGRHQPRTLGGINPEQLGGFHKNSHGTPMVVWKKADGSEGRIDGLPQDWDVVISSLAGGANVARR